jgi:hypothetical protein
MMKRNYKKTVGSSITFLAVFLLASSMVQGANPNQSQGNAGNGVSRPDKTVIQGNKTEKICNNFENAYSKIGQKMSETGKNIASKRQERLQNFTQKETELKTKLEAKRAEIDTNFAAHIEKMTGLAKTDEAKTAVAKFQTAVKTAMQTRRNSVDATRTAFQAQVQSRIGERKAAVDSLVSEYQNAIKAAFDKAKADCASGGDAATVRNTLRESLRAAKEKMQTEKQNMEKVKTELQAEIKTRNDAIQKADQDFKAALEAAKTELQKSFPGTTE